MMPPVAEQTDGEIDRLKKLLFQPEEQRLAALQATVDALNLRLGTPARMEAATAEIIVEALRRAEIEQPREMASAIAPMVVSAIRNEIRNSRDMMVEALYPITGRMVSAAVANAFRELLLVLQQRIDALTSTAQWRWRIRSWMTDRPVSEIAMAEVGGFRLNRLMLIERGSGRLMAAWHANVDNHQSPELISGMISAITDFSVQALAGAGELRTLDFGGREVVVRASSLTIVAAECAGVLRPGDNAAIDEAFLKLVDSIDHGRPADDGALKRLAEALQPATVPTKPSRSSALVLGGIAAIAAIAMAWIATVAVIRWQFETKVAAAHSALVASHAELKAYPLELTFDHARQTVRLQGLHPATLDPENVTGPLRLAAAPYRLEASLAAVIVPPQLDMAKQAAAAAEQRMSEQERKTAARADDIAARLGAIEAQAATAEARLSRFVQSAAVFFGLGDSFVDPPGAQRAFDELAQLLAGNNLRLRIVGYTDASGGAEANMQLSRKRIEAVIAALVERGVDRRRLVGVPRGAAMPITDTLGGPGAANRRVTFERVFAAESEP
jgi:outer membrane protein OmpA-like peptidoglycan-associated protein